MDHKNESNDFQTHAAQVRQTAGIPVLDPSEPRLTPRQLRRKNLIFASVLVGFCLLVSTRTFWVMKSDFTDAEVLAIQQRADRHWKQRQLQQEKQNKGDSS